MSIRISYLVPAALLLALPLSAQGPGGGPPTAGGPIPPLPEPAGNPTTPAKRLLGKALFWEEQLSATRTMACATCHVPSAGGSDPRSMELSARHPGFDGVLGTDDDVQGSPGVIRNLPDGLYSPHAVFGFDAQVTGRKAPTMIKAAFAPLLFWDGRAEGTFVDPETGSVVLGANAALESQAVGPILDEVEMGSTERTWSDVILRLETSEPLALASNLSQPLANFVEGRTYPDLFADAFGSQEITGARIGMALASYQRTLISDQIPLDQGPVALTQIENQGRQIFNTVGRCNTCHGGPFLTDFDFHNTGVTPNFEDLGRGAITGVPADNGRFKTPDLRNVELRAPYFHDGSAASLEEVVEFYDRGGDFPQGQAPQVQPLNLTQQQKDALVAFLQRPLTDPRVAAETGPFRRPTLYSETALQPTSFGTGTAAIGGAPPELIVVEPPIVGNPNLTVALSDAPQLGQGFLGIDFAQGQSQLLGAEVLLGLTPSLRLLQLGPLTPDPLVGGHRSTALSIPDEASLVGLPVFLQGFVFAGGLSSTQGVELVLF